MVKDVRGEARTEEAYRRFVRWCDSNGFKPENASNFKAMMKNVADVKYKRAAGAGRLAAASNFIIGYRLRGDDEFIPTDEPTPWDDGEESGTEQMAMKV